MKKMSLIIRPMFLVVLSICSNATYAVTCTMLSADVWDTGYAIEYLVTNNNTVELPGWSVVIDLPDDSSLATHWNSTVLNSTPLTLSSAPWSPILAPEESIIFGISGSKSEVFSVPDCIDSADFSLIPPLV